MRAKVKTTHHECHGQNGRVVEILSHRFICLEINGRKIDFGLSEVDIIPDASAGKAILWEFVGPSDRVLLRSHINRIAKRAANAWSQQAKQCAKALHVYLET